MPKLLNILQYMLLFITLQLYSLYCIFVLNCNAQSRLDSCTPQFLVPFFCNTF